MQQVFAPVGGKGGGGGGVGIFLAKVERKERAWEEGEEELHPRYPSFFPIIRQAVIGGDDEPLHLRARMEDRVHGGGGLEGQYEQPQQSQFVRGPARGGPRGRRGKKT